MRQAKGGAQFDRRFVGAESGIGLPQRLTGDAEIILNVGDFRSQLRGAPKDSDRLAEPPELEERRAVEIKCVPMIGIRGQRLLVADRSAGQVTALTQSRGRLKPVVGRGRTRFRQKSGSFRRTASARGALSEPKSSNF